MKLNTLKVKESVKQYADNEIQSVSYKDIAIIGISGKFPLADNPEEYWENIKNGRDCIRSFPEERKEKIELFYPGDNEYFECGYLDEIDKFDYSFFHISPKDANLMDPHQRMFLQTAYNAIEDAGYSAEKIKGKNIGVFVGMSDLGDLPYIDLVRRAEPEFLVQAFQGNTKAILPSRVSYTLDLHGPSMLTDTACSSSLVSLANACKSLRDKECDMAVAGGVKLYFLPLKERPLLGIESSDGKTRAFDNSSDGTGVGEGSIAVLLKPLNQAIKDRNHIYAVIKGVATNQDGRTIGISAPNPDAQADVIERAWKDARIDPLTINYIEAHGTGTRLGDSIEINGLTKAFERYTDLKNFCAISTVKTNIGHLYDLSGMASLIKVIMEFKYKQLAPSIHFDVPNKTIDFENSSVYINDKLRNWEAVDKVRRCSISSFGFSGTNCSIVLEEAPSNKVYSESSSLQVIALSARNKEELIQLISNYYFALENDKNINIGDFCYTANTGRDDYEYRIAAIVEDKTEFINLLKDFMDSKLELTNIQNDYMIFSNIKAVDRLKEGSDKEVLANNNDKIAIDEEIKSNLNLFNETGKKDKNLLKLICDLYIKGGQVDWKIIYSGEKRNRISIPGYPLKKNECWVKVPNGKINKDFKDINELFEFKGLPERARKKILAILNKHDSKVSNDLEIESNEVELCGSENGKYTNTEKLIADIWSKILGCTKLNIFDDYLDIGGDSISGAKIINMLNKATNKNLKIAHMLEHRTIREFSKYVDNFLAENISLPEIVEAEKKEYYPISSSQKRIFITSLMHKEVYNVPGVLLIKGKIDFNKLEEIIRKVAEHHEILRTTFEYRDSNIVQVVHEKPVISIQYHEREEAGIDEFIKTLIKSFDFSKLPLFYFHIIKVEEERYYLVYNFHHIITDGTSHGVFLKNVIDLYNNKELQETDLQYKDYAVWQNKIIKEGYLKKQEKFLLNKFADEIPALELECDYNRPAIKSYNGENVFFQISEDLREKLDEFANTNKCTTFVILLSAYSILLAKNSNQNKILIGVPVAGREDKKLENMIGTFINSVVVKAEINDSLSLFDFIQEMNNEVLEVLRNQEYPFDMLVEKLNHSTDRSRQSLFNTMFQFQNMNIPRINSDKLSVDRYEIENNIALFDITLEIFKNDNKMDCRFKYCKDLFKKETIGKWKEDYLNILEAITTNNDIDIKELTKKKVNKLPKLKDDFVEFNFD